MSLEQPEIPIPFTRLFEYHERGTPKAYAIGRQHAIEHDHLALFEATFRARFVYIEGNPQA